MKPSETQWISMFIDFLSLSAWAFRDGFHLLAKARCLVIILLLECLCAIPKGI